MTLVRRKIRGKEYYYSSLSYFLIDKSRSFSKYIGVGKPSERKLGEIEDLFKEEIIERLSGKRYTSESIDKGEVVKSLLFSNLFNKKYGKMTELKRRKYDVDSTVLFTLTTLTTEEVDVSMADVKNAMERGSSLTQKEQISRNMLNAVESIRQPHALDKRYLLELHRITMASFETKNPGRIRDRQVYLHRIVGDSQRDFELSYRPPGHDEVDKLLEGIFESSRWNG